MNITSPKMVELESELPADIKRTVWAVESGLVAVSHIRSGDTASAVFHATHAAHWGLSVLDPFARIRESRQ